MITFNAISNILAPGAERSPATGDSLAVASSPKPDSSVRSDSVDQSQYATLDKKKDKDNRSGGNDGDGDSDTLQRASALDSEALAQRMEIVQQAVDRFDNKLKFSVAESNGRTIIEVIDPDTEEVVRQIPPEQMVRMADALAESGDSESLSLLGSLSA